MKQIFSLALALVMLLSLSTTAFAAEITDSGSVDVTYTYEGPANSYIVTIPDSMTVGTDATVSVSDVKLTGTVLTVSVSSQQYNEGWKLTSEHDTVGYTLKIGGTDVTNNGTVLTANNGDTLVSATLVTALAGTPKYSGNYTDTLTFSVTLTACAHTFEDGACTKCGMAQPQASYTVENGVATITVPTDAATGSITTCISAALTEGATTITIDGALTADQQSELATALEGNTTLKIVFEDMNLADLSDDVKWMGNPIDTANGAILEVGSCGENAQYMIYHTGDDNSRTLSIKGTGAMANYDGNSYAPWFDQESYQIPNNITKVEIAEDITTIGDNTFGDGYGIASVTLPESITSIGWRGFASCLPLTSITIPKNVTSISSYAFAACRSLESVTVLATTPPTLGTNVFNNCSENLIIYVPAESVDTYKSAWSDYAEKIQPIQ